jgi:hypothetical protein
MGVGGLTCSPAGALRARPAMCGALGRASVNSGAANQWSPTMSTLSIKSRNTKSAPPKKGSAQSKTASRRKVTSPAGNAKKPTRSVESKAERVAAAKTLRKADEPKVEWHLDESQRAMVANVRQGARTELQLKTKPPCCSTLASVRFSAPADVIIQPRLTIVAMAITPNSTDDLNKRGFQRLMRWSRGVDHSQFGPTPQARRGSKIDWTSAAKDALLCGSAG